MKPAQQLLPSQDGGQDCSAECFCQSLAISPALETPGPQDSAFNCGVEGGSASPQDKLPLPCQHVGANKDPRLLTGRDS